MAEKTWLKLFHGDASDAVLELLTDAQYRVWVKLLCLAGEQPERGVIAGMPFRLLALRVSLQDVQLLSETLNLLQEWGYVDVDGLDIVFTDPRAEERFADQRGNAPSDSPERVRERVQRCRARARGKADPSQHEIPPQSLTVTSGNGCNGGNDQEEKREELEEKRPEGELSTLEESATPRVEAQTLPNSPQEFSLPAIFERFSLCGELELFSRRHFDKPCFDPSGYQVQLLEQFEKQLTQLQGLAASVLGMMVLAPVERRCLEDFWRNQLQNKASPFTSSIFARLIGQAVTDLAATKAKGPGKKTGALAVGEFKRSGVR